MDSCDGGGTSVDGRRRGPSSSPFSVLKVLEIWALSLGFKKWALLFWPVPIYFPGPALNDSNRARADRGTAPSRPK